MEDLRNEFIPIEDTNEARDKFGHNYGSETKILTIKNIEELRKGKILATDINGCEYTLFLELEKCGDKEWQHCRVEKMGCIGCYYDHGKEKQ